MLFSCSFARDTFYPPGDKKHSGEGISFPPLSPLHYRQLFTLLCITGSNIFVGYEFTFLVLFAGDTFSSFGDKKHNREALFSWDFFLSLVYVTERQGFHCVSFPFTRFGRWEKGGVCEFLLLWKSTDTHTNVHTHMYTRAMVNMKVSIPRVSWKAVKRECKKNVKQKRRNEKNK